MDIFLKPLAELLQPPWNYLLGLGFLVILAAPRLVELRREFLDAQMGRRRLEFEKLHLEILKLRLELEALGERQETPELERKLQEIPIVPQPAPAPKRPAPERRGRFREWLTQHPIVTVPIMLLLQIFLGFLMVVFAVSIVAVPFAAWSDKELGLGPGLSVFLALVYGALAWASYKGFVASRSMRKELTAR